MALDDSLYCTMRDVMRDCPALEQPLRERMLKALEGYRGLELVAEGAATRLQGCADPVPRLMLVAALGRLEGV